MLDVIITCLLSQTYLRGRVQLIREVINNHAVFVYFLFLLSSTSSLVDVAAAESNNKVAQAGTYDNLLFVFFCDLVGCKHSLFHYFVQLTML